jgi:response regulator of citrate/malate metabolism
LGQRAWLPIDVIAVTSARDLDVVRSAVALGIVQYVVKPFTAAMLREKLERYADYHRRMSGAAGPVAQHEVDDIIARLRGSSLQTLPKKISEETLHRVIVALRETGDSVSAAELGEHIGLARVTARRYLEYLADIDLVERAATYGGPGRPEHRYRWAEHS